MSVTYEFYFGYKSKDGVFHEYGPYNKRKDGTYCLIPIALRGSNINQTFLNKFSVENDKNKIGEEIQNFAVDYDFSDEELDTFQLHYLPFSTLSSLASKQGIISAYVEKEAVNAFELYRTEGTDFSEYETDYISPIVYATMSKKEQAKYMLYTWLDYTSEGYLANQILQNVFTFTYTNEALPLIFDENIYIYFVS